MAPAGLYFAILMKRADPRHEVTVIERNRPDDTFGFGVVFSDATLDNLLEADPDHPYRDHPRFAHWDDIDVHYRGEVLALDRPRLLRPVAAEAARASCSGARASSA